MTIGNKTPFRETLVADRKQLQSCPRLPFVVEISSSATPENSALMCVPHASCVMELEVSCISFAVESVHGDEVIDASTRERLLSIKVNLCLRLTDDCGRPHGPFIPVAAIENLGGHISTYHVPYATRVTIPLPRAKRVAWCIKMNSPLDPRFLVVCSIAGAVLVTSLAEAFDCRLQNSLAKMMKNSGIDPRGASAVQLTFEGTEGSKRPRSEVDPTDDSTRSRTNSLVTRNLLRVDSEMIPELIHAFVQGGADES